MAEEDRVRRAKLVREEARETISEQSATLSDIDEKAIQIFRVNVVLAGVLVSGLSITVQSSNATTAGLVNPFTKFGSVLLFTATVLAAVTYTSTNEEIGVSAEDVTNRILDDEFDYDLVQLGLAEAYGVWIANNYRINARNALLFTLTLLTTIMAICYLFIGAIEVYNPGLPWYTNAGALVLFAVVAKLSKLRIQFERWWHLTSPQKRFSNWLLGWREFWTESIAIRLFRRGK